MQQYRWIWVPTLNFFGGVVAFVEGVVTHSKGCTAVGVILMVFCLLCILAMRAEGERWL